MNGSEENYNIIMLVLTKCISCEQGLKKPKYINFWRATICTKNSPTKKQGKSRKTCFNFQKACDNNPDDIYLL